MIRAPRLTGGRRAERLRRSTRAPRTRCRRCRRASAGQDRRNRAGRSRVSRPLLRALIGLAISAIALALVVRQVDLDAAWEVLREASPGLGRGHGRLHRARRHPARPALARPARADRPAPARRPSPRRCSSATWPTTSSRRASASWCAAITSGIGPAISRASVLGTVVVERVVDTGVLVAIASAAIVVLSVRGIVASAVLLGLAATGLLVAGLALALVAHRLPFADRVVAALERRPAVARAASRLRGGLAVAGRPRTMAGAIGWTRGRLGGDDRRVRRGRSRDRPGADLGPGGAPGGGRLARHGHPGRARLRGHVRARGGARSAGAVGIGADAGVRARAARPRGDPGRHLAWAAWSPSWRPGAIASARRPLGRRAHRGGNAPLTAARDAGDRGRRRRDARARDGASAGVESSRGRRPTAPASPGRSASRCRTSPPSPS